MKIGLLTAFSDLVPQYSLTGVVLDQIRMIRHAGHEPVLLTLEDFNCQTPRALSLMQEYEFEVRPVLPHYHKLDYRSVSEMKEEHRVVSERAATVILQQNDLRTIFTHDILFTGWNLPLNMAVQQAARASDVFWLHWVHSVPGGMKRDYWRLPPNGKLVYPNETDRIRCAEHFLCPSTRVAVIPHSLDPRNFLMTDSAAKALVTEYDVLSADFVQTYPVPTDRMEFKGIEKVIHLFGHLKSLGKSVRLIVCNSWSNTDANRTKVSRALSFAESCGLTRREVIFTSLYDSVFETGVPNGMIRDLMQVSNLFICPTQSETFGITIAEAALTGQLLVLNSNLPAIIELAGAENVLQFTFGSLQQKVDTDDWNSFLFSVARIILNRFENDAALRAKTHYRQQYNMDAVWKRIEGEILAADGAELPVVSTGRRIASAALDLVI